MIVTNEHHDQRLDRFLKTQFPSLGFGQAQKLIRTGQIRINGKRAKADSRIAEHDELRLPPSLLNTSKRDIEALSDKDRRLIENMIIFEDNALLVLNKPAGLPVQGGTKTYRHIDALMQSATQGGLFKSRPKLVHRLDRDTSGVLILAKTSQAAKMLTHDFQSHDIQKTYWALTCPAPIQENGTIDAKLEKSPARRDGGEMMVHAPDTGKKAITDFEILDRAGKKIAFVAFYPKTGRTHQIRVHAALIGAPLLGDRKYNVSPFGDMEKEDMVYDGLHLHAREITLKHPENGAEMTFLADLDIKFLKSWKSFGFQV